MQDEFGPANHEQIEDDGPPSAIESSTDDESVDADGGEAEALLALNRELVARYRAALLASDASIEPDLVVGDTADEIEASFASAQRLVAGIRDAVRREQTPSVPAGSPGRTTVGPRTAYDKIRAGLSRI